MLNHILSALAAVILFPSYDRVDLPSPAEPSYARFTTDEDPVNAVIGNESFRARFGREPNSTDDEELRMATHLQYVEAKLRARPVDHLSPELRAERLRNLDRLREYRLSQPCPSNYDMPERRPCFIDRDGAICAVGYLIERSAGRDVAEKINDEYKYALIAEMNSSIVADWIAGSGLTREEAAMIQPVYEPVRLPADCGVTVGAGIVAQSGFIPPLIDEMSNASDRTRLGGMLSGGLYFDLPIRPVPKLYLHVRPTVEYRWGGFEDEGIAIAATNGFDTINDFSSRFAVDYQYVTFNTDLMFGYYLGSEVRRSNCQVLIGPTIGVGGVVGDEYRERLIPEDGVPDMRPVASHVGEVADDQKSLIIRDEGIDNVPVLRVGLKGGIRWRDALRQLPLMPRDIYGAFSLWYSYDLTPLVSGSDWRSHSVNLSVDVSLAGRPFRW